MVSTALVAESIAGLDFPANKQKLIDFAKSHGGNREVVDVLKRIPDKEYGSSADLMRGVGGVEQPPCSVILCLP